MSDGLLTFLLEILADFQNEMNQKAQEKYEV